MSETKNCLEQTKKPYRTLGNLGKDFYETINNLLTINNWDYDLFEITIETLKELIDDIQNRFDLQSNTSIAHIITKQIPIFSKTNNLYSISKEFREYVPRYSNESFYKECFLRFCYTNSRVFQNYCNELFYCLRIEKKTQRAIISKIMLKIIERHFKSYKYTHRKLLKDLGLISIEKGKVICNLKRYSSIIEHWKIALKVIQGNAHEIYDSFHKEPRTRELDCSEAYKLLEKVGFSKPKEIVEELRNKEKILVRSIRRGNYIEC